MKTTLITLLIALVSQVTWAQFTCKTWNDSPRQVEGEEAHSIYRQALKSKDYQLAFEYWKIAYEIAPAADGNRDFHLTDGIKMYKHFLSEAQDEAKKEEYKKTIIQLYDECVACYEQRVIALNDCDDDCYEQKIGFIRGRQGYDMFYELNSNYEANYEVLSKAISTNDVGTEYIVLEPLAHIAVYQYQKGKLEAAELRNLYADIERIGEYNIENSEDYSEYYDSSMKRALAKFKEVEDEIFDCAFFKEKWLPVYEADPKNFETIKQVVVTLKRHGCPDDDPDLARIEGEYERMAAEYNAEVQAEFERKNPHVMAKRLYDEGQYKEAAMKYEEAIAMATEAEKKAQYLFSKASIEGRKLGDLSAAKASLKEAVSLRENWGRPYMLLGDLYASQARKCGDNWAQGLGVLAAIAQYSKAKSVDESVSAEASSRIAKYQGSKPDGEEAFMIGKKAGDAVAVGCGIGETVILSFR